MATTEKGFVLPTVSASDNTWGTTLNTAFDKLDDILGDTFRITTQTGTETLSAADQDCVHIELPSSLTLTGNVLIRFTGAGGMWTIRNGATANGTYTVTCDVSGGTAVTIPADHKRLIYCNTTTNEIEIVEDNTDTVAEVTIASGATTDIFGAASPYIYVTGTTGITSFGTGANLLRYVRFAAALTITHHATTLICPYAEDLVVAAGDVIMVQSASDSDARIINVTFNDETDFSQHHELEIGVDVQAYDLNLDELAAMASTRGNIMRGDSSGAWEALTIGTDGQGLISDGTDIAWSSETLAAKTAAAGSMLLGDGSNYETELTIGAANTVLKSNGTTAAWGVSGGILLETISLGTGTTKASAAIDTTTFPTIRLVFLKCAIDNDDGQLQMRFGTSSTFSAVSYSSGLFLTTTLVGTSTANPDITDGVLLASSQGSDTDEDVTGWVEIYDLGAAQHTVTVGQMQGYRTSSGSYYQGQVQSRHSVKTAYDQVQFLADALDLNGGTVKIYGYP